MKRRGKYNNVRTTVAGKRFDSKMELRRWQDLELLLEVGAISELQHHVRYPLEINGVKLGYYECDAQYRMGNDIIVEDTKGMRTAVYRLKAKLMKAIHGIEIQEIKTK